MSLHIRAHRPSRSESELSRDGVKDKSVIEYSMEALQEKYQMRPAEGTSRAVVESFGSGPRALSPYKASLEGKRYDSTGQSLSGRISDSAR